MYIHIYMYLHVRQNVICIPMYYVLSITTFPTRKITYVLVKLTTNRTFNSYLPWSQFEFSSVSNKVVSQIRSPTSYVWVLSLSQPISDMLRWTSMTPELWYICEPGKIHPKKLELPLAALNKNYGRPNSKGLSTNFVTNFDYCDPQIEMEASAASGRLRTALDLWKQRQPRISLGCDVLDNHFDGGFPRSGIVEVLS